MPSYVLAESFGLAQSRQVTFLASASAAAAALARASWVFCFLSTDSGTLQGENQVREGRAIRGGVDDTNASARDKSAAATTGSLSPSKTDLGTAPAEHSPPPLTDASRVLTATARQKAIATRTLSTAAPKGPTPTGLRTIDAYWPHNQLGRISRAGADHSTDIYFLRAGPVNSRPLPCLK